MRVPRICSCLHLHSAVCISLLLPPVHGPAQEQLSEKWNSCARMSMRFVPSISDGSIGTCAHVQHDHKTVAPRATQEMCWNPCHPCCAVTPQNMYAQLRQGGAAGGMVSWRRMFDFLLSICQLYSDIEADTRVTKHFLQTALSPASHLVSSLMQWPQPPPCSCCGL